MPEFSWWAGILTADAQTSYAITQARNRVNVNRGYNFTRGIGCNLLVAMAFIFATQGRDNVSKIYGVWIPIAIFVALGYQHSIANFYLVPIGMFYGTDFGVGKFIRASIIPVTLGNIVGGAVLGALAFWVLYGKHEQSVTHAGGQGSEV